MTQLKRRQPTTRGQIVATCILLLGATIGRAEPDSTMRWFMDEPVSLFDFGLYQVRNYLETDLDEFPPLGDEAPSYVPVYYDWDKNRIYIWVKVVDDRATKMKLGQEEISDWCDRVFSYIREIKFGPNTYEPFFGHEGYKRDGQPKDIATHLARLTMLFASVPASMQDQVVCESTLTRESVSTRRERFGWYPN